METHGISFSKLNETLKEHTLPAMLVDMNALDRNIERIRLEIERSGKKMRIASKSIRVPGLLKYILEKGGNSFQGLLCYTIDEALFLSEEGFSDFVIAYPTSGSGELKRAVKAIQEKNIQLTLMIDRIEHIQILERACKELGFNGKVPVAIDLDVSTEILGQHLGVQRSSIRNIGNLKKLIDEILKKDFLVLDGLMGYEAQIAGVTDRKLGKNWMNLILDFFKKISIRQVYHRRQEVSQYLKKKKIQIRFFNGGGTGSLLSTLKEEWLTEVTAGSGFLQSQLFDYYQGNRNEPAVMMVLRVTRNPEPGVFTFHSGGYIASGEIGSDRQPKPFWPEDMRTLKSEGFGEVQTPIRSNHLKIGEIGIFRPSKAGEIAERFNEYLLFRNDQIEKTVPTYRGLGKNFG